MRSTWILIAILVVLIPIAGAVYYLRYKTAADREARWQTMRERGDSGEVINGPTDGPPVARNTMFAAQADVEAIPVPVQVEGPVAETKKIELAWTDADGAQGVLRGIDGCTPTGEGRDVIWQGADLYLATATDKLRRIWTTDEPGCSFGPHPSFICFDGRYVWAPLTRPGGAPRLIVVDPQDEQAWEYRYAGDNGVPPYSASATKEYRLGVASLSPGKVCAAIRVWEPPAVPASGPPTRSVATKLWFGTFEFESPDQRTAASFPVTAGVELLDGPFEMLTLVADGTRAVLVGRGDFYPPVIIDPDARQVKAAASKMGTEPLGDSRGQPFVVHDGAVWYLKRIRPAHEPTTEKANDVRTQMTGRPALAKATLPDLKEEVVLREVPTGLLVSNRGGLHIIGERCWRLRGSGPELEAIAVQPPWQFEDDPNRNLVPNGNAARAETSADGPASATPARDPYAARQVFASGIYGLLVSAAVDRTPDETDRVVYQLSIPPTASTGGTP